MGEQEETRLQLMFVFDQIDLKNPSPATQGAFSGYLTHYEQTRGALFLDMQQR